MDLLGEARYNFAEWRGVSSKRVGPRGRRR
jgi:hypothetical protein